MDLNAAKDQDPESNLELAQEYFFQIYKFVESFSLTLTDFVSAKTIQKLAERFI